MDQKPDPTQTPPAATDQSAPQSSSASGTPETPVATQTAAPEETPSAATETPAAAAQTPAAPAAPGSDPAKILSSEPAPKGKSKSTVVVVGIALLVIVLGGAYLFFFKHSAPSTKIAQNTVTPTAAVSPSPEVTPVTATNVDQTLNNVDTTMQQTSTQATTDINTVSNIDSTQDNTSGL